MCLIGTVILITSGNVQAQSKNDRERVLSVGGSITEIVYALGQDHRLVARDTTSSFPETVLDLPDVGYMRALSPEGVLSVDPDLVIAEAGSGPPETMEVLRDSDIDLVLVPDGFDRAAIRTKIETVATALGVTAVGVALADKVDLALVEATEAAANHTQKRRVLFILSTQGGRIMASGAGTAADGIIALAGGENAITEFIGYKPLTAEAIVVAAPDVVLMMDRGGDHGMANDELFAMPALATTPAAVTRNVVRMDGLLLLGFGPRTPDAVRDLNAALYRQD